jgi:hypothetical protein
MTIIPERYTWKRDAIMAAIGLIIGVLIAMQLDCHDEETTATVIEGPGRTLVYTDHDTVTTTRLVYRDRWHVVNAPGAVVYDTTRESVTTPPYIARLDTVTGTSDTIGVTYRHPEQTFDLAFRPRPDSIRTVTVETTQVVSVPDRDRIGFGIAAGIGGIIGIDGVARPGGYIGVGINFNIWEP